MDEAIYEAMRLMGFSGLEVAPTRVFSDSPYDDLQRAAEWSRTLHEQYGFFVSSIQSIWYGRTEHLFTSEAERSVLLEYTKKAIRFAAAIGCKNLVFGCPQSRVLPLGIETERANAIAIEFFGELGFYAYDHGTILAIEANPPIYHTNFINTTASALKLVNQVNSRGFLLNVDVGTIIQNNEEVSSLGDSIQWINHVHISEPYLKPIKKRALHKELISVLKASQYKGYISIEMGKQERADDVKTAMEYLISLQVG